jgi:hypothetical protein
MRQDVHMAKSIEVLEEEEARASANERPACGHKVLNSLSARRHRKDPEVWDAEVRGVEPLTPSLLVGQEFADKGGLGQALPRDRHRAPVGFKEEVGASPVHWRSVELQAEDTIRLKPQTVELPVLADLDLPAERQAQAPGLRWRSREHLLGRDEMHALAVPTGDLEGHHDLGDRERVVKEDPGEVPVLHVPPDASRPRHTLGLEDLCAALPQGIDQGLGAPGVPVELHGRAIKVAVVEEELEAAKRCLPASSPEGREVGRAKEPMAVNGSKDVEIAWREDHWAYRGALEARPTGLRVRHWDSSVPAGR